MGSCIRCPIRSTLLPSFPAGTPALVTGTTDGGKTEHACSRWSKKKQKTPEQAGARRNRLNNNTTRLSPAPDQAICNCWHKRTLAGYPTVSDNRGHAQLDRPTLADFPGPIQIGSSFRMQRVRSQTQWAATNI